MDLAPLISKDLMSSEDLAQNRPYRPKYEQVAEQIAMLIVTAQLKPGDRLPTERALGEQLGISRSVIRDAVKILTARRLIYVRKGSGMHVAELPVPEKELRESEPYALLQLEAPVRGGKPPLLALEHLVSYYEFRLILESHCAELAAERITLREMQKLKQLEALHEESAQQMQAIAFRDADTEFHQVIADASHNPFLISTIATSKNLHIHGTTFLDAVVDQQHMLRAVQQHRAILAAIEQGNASLAAEAMRIHVQTTLQECREEIHRRLQGSDEG